MGEFQPALRKEVFLILILTFCTLFPINIYMENNGLSIVIPCYNTGGYLPDAVASVSRQHMGDVPYEIIVVDDASDCEITINALNDIENSGDDRIRVITLSKNSGAPSHPRNVGIAFARYDKTMSLDGDDMLRPTSCVGDSYLYQACARLDEDDDILGVYCDARLIGAKSGKWMRLGWNEKGALINARTGCFTVYRTKEMREMSLTRTPDQRGNIYNESLTYSDDWECLIGMLNHRYMQGKPRNVVKLEFDEPPILYRQHADQSNISSRKQNKAKMFGEFYRQFPQIYKEYYPHVTGQAFAGEYLASLQIGKYAKNAVIAFQEAAKAIKGRSRPRTAIIARTLK